MDVKENLKNSLLIQKKSRKAKKGTKNRSDKQKAIMVHLRQTIPIII